MKIPAREAAYEAARTWAVQPISHPPSGWAQIVRSGIATWMQETPQALAVPFLSPEPACLDRSPLLTVVAAMIAEVCL